MYRYLFIVAYLIRCSDAKAHLHIFTYRLLYAGISVKAHIPLYGCNPVFMQTGTCIGMSLFTCPFTCIRTSFYTGLPIAIPRYIRAYLFAYLRSYAATFIHTYSVNAGCRYKGMQIYTCFIEAVLFWRSVAVFGSVAHCNALAKQPLLCIGSNTKG